MRIFGFRPALVPTLFTIPAIIAMLCLGTWQVQRMGEKNRLIGMVEARVHADPVPLPIGPLEPEAWEYRRVTVTGTFRHNGEMHLLAPAAMGTAGYHVITPLDRAEGGQLLINRGWVPTNRADPSSRREGLVEGPVTITGIVRKSWRRGSALTTYIIPENDPARNVWFHADLAAMARQAGLTDAPMITIDADATPVPGGWPKGGQTRLDFPNNHLAYVVTWYSGAIVLAIIYVVWHRRREKEQSGT